MALLPLPMVSFLSALTQKAGMEPERARKGLEVLLKTLHGRISDKSFHSITSRIPDFADIAESNAPASRDQLDIWNSALGAEKSEARKPSQSPLTEVLTELAKAGFSRNEAQAFLPVAFQLLKKQLPPGLIMQVERGIPGLSNLTTSAPPSLFERLKNLI
jgi:hypothetical protein